MKANAPVDPATLLEDLGRNLYEPQYPVVIFYLRILNEEARAAVRGIIPLDCMEPHVRAGLKFGTIEKLAREYTAGWVITRKMILEHRDFLAAVLQKLYGMNLIQDYRIPYAG